MDIAGRIKELRAKKGLSQAALAGRIGVSQRAVSYYESGKDNPSRELMIKIAKVFDVSVDYLLGLSDEPENIDNVYKTVGAVQIPIYKLNQLGEVFADSNIIGWHDVPVEHMNKKAFQVPDDSMSGIRLYAGDNVLVNEQNSVHDGQVAVVKIAGGSGMIRRVKYSDNGIILYPENPKYKSELYSADQVQIIGLVTDAFFKVK